MAFILIIVLAVLFLFFYFKIRKIPKLGNMTLVTGGIKTGKSTLSVYLAYRTYKRNHTFWKISCFFIKLFNKLKFKRFQNVNFPEEPLLYSNIPLNVPFVPLTSSLILRNERFNYKSVLYVCECSLLADSMSFKDDFLNENMLLLNKLFAHETRGGSLFYDTQSISDNHYSIKRSLSSYLYIHHTIKFIPFFIFCWVKELKYSDDNSTIQNFDKDVEEDLKLIIIPKSVWKLFDCYCYSALTDDLDPVTNLIKKPKSLKAYKIVSFKPYKTLLYKRRIPKQ